MIFNIKPVSKPRMTRRDKWAKRECVLDYYTFKDELLLQAKVNGANGTFELPDEFRVVFGIPFPRSYSVKRKELLLGSPNRVKPDLDNYLKALMDVFQVNDAGIWHIEASKIWTKGSGFILIEDFDEQDHL